MMEDGITLLLGLILGITMTIGFICNIGDIIPQETINDYYRYHSGIIYKIKVTTVNYKTSN